MPLDPTRFCSLAALCGVLLTAGTAQAERLDCRLVASCPSDGECRNAPIGIVLERDEAGWHWSMPGQFGPQPMLALPASGEEGTPFVLYRLNPHSRSISVYSLFADGSLWATSHYSLQGESRAATARGDCQPG